MGDNRGIFTRGEFGGSMGIGFANLGGGTIA